MASRGTKKIHSDRAEYGRDSKGERFSALFFRVAAMIYAADDSGEAVSLV